MIKFCLNLKNYFSSSILPYNPKGYKNIQKYIEHHELIQKRLSTLEIQEDQFIFAFNNFIDSIQDEDFNEFAREVCDQKLANSFIEGLQRIQNEELKFEKIVDDETEEQIYFTDMNIFVNVNRNVSLFDHEILLNKPNKFPKVTALFSQGEEIMVCLSIGALIKSKVSLIISDQKYEPENFHHVRFMVLKDEFDQNGFFQTLKMAFLLNEKQMFLGQNPTWKIIDIDKYLQKQYPQFF
ncbi:unnamed protein product [Paramecium octaurelia]|uniref:Uncharacterized protein n=1 Tax=Paramecium octaurelia TaxID=43137 RepID=A0A8S1RZX2_PAROT|nr:unnamed protein product [Paramecium octaurelia]